MAAESGTLAPAEWLRRPTRQLVVFVALATIVFGTVVSVEQYVMSQRTHPVGIGVALLFGALSATVFGSVMLASARYDHLRLDPYGITVARSLHPTYTIPWARITHITTGSNVTGRFVELYDGPRRVKLPVPVDHWTMPNPHFDAEAAHITSWWAHYRMFPPPPY